ncbi:hypothetical protein A2U01_0097293 [Trifolium medium]|nr:hypothetical protein [Trifolium medium]
MSSFLPNKSKIERRPAFSPESLLKNPYDGYLKSPSPAESPRRASPH